MRTLLFASILLFSGIGHSSQETHGGNGFIADFLSVYDELMQPEFKSCYDLLPNQRDHQNLLRLRKELEVRSQPWVEFEGRPVGAINQPLRSPRLVVISEDYWKTSNLTQKKALVLHELVHLLGYRNESPTYLYSAPILSCIKKMQSIPDSPEDKFDRSDMCDLIQNLIYPDVKKENLDYEDRAFIEANCGPGI